MHDYESLDYNSELIHNRESLNFQDTNPTPSYKLPNYNPTRHEPGLTIPDYNVPSYNIPTPLPPPQPPPKLQEETSEETQFMKNNKEPINEFEQRYALLCGIQRDHPFIVSLKKKGGGGI